MSVMAVYVRALVGLCTMLVYMYHHGACARGSAGDLEDGGVLSYIVVEGVPANTVVGQLIQDSGLHGKYNRELLDTFNFAILSGSHKDLFSVDKYRGLLRLSQGLDREAMCPQKPDCVLSLDVAIVKPSQYFQIFKVAVTILDQNDNAPAFPEQEMTLRVSESAAPGVSFVLPVAEDLDSNQNGVQAYQLVSNSTLFGLQTLQHYGGAQDVKLELLGSLDREQEETHTLAIVAVDGGTPPRSGTLIIHVEVVDANDNPPEFDRMIYNVTVMEDAEPGNKLLTVHARDMDDGANGNIVYALAPQTAATVGSLFDIDGVTGDMYLRGHLDFETQTVYNLLISAMDQGPNTVPAYAKVMVNVQDVNDFVPRITVNTLTSSGEVQIPENSPTGHFVAHISVEDMDGGPSGHVTCLLLDNQAGVFTMQQIYDHEYKISTNVVFDRERQDLYDIQISCHDEGMWELSTSAGITVYILDENDNVPRFEHPLYSVSMPENGHVGSSVVQVRAADLDIGQNGKIVYSLENRFQNLLSIDATSGVISTVVVLDHERVSLIETLVFAADGGSEPLTATAAVQIKITDLNDEAPMFLRPFYSFGTFENQPVGTEIGGVSATDADAPPNNALTYSLLEDRDSRAFKIEPHSGRIVTLRILDREHQPEHHLVAIVTDVRDAALQSSASITVHVADRNDNAPSISYPNRMNNTLTVADTAVVGQAIGQVQAWDPDLGVNARLTYSIAKSNDPEYLTMDPDSGLVTLNKDLGWASPKEFHVTVIVKDGGTPVKSSVADMYIHVKRSSGFRIGSIATKPSGEDYLLGANVTKILAASDKGLDVGEGLPFHQMIIIALACTTVVLAAILILIIACLRHRCKRNRAGSKPYRYSGPITFNPHENNASQGQGRSPGQGDGKVDRPKVWVEQAGTADGGVVPHTMVVEQLHDGTALQGHDLSASSSGISTSSEGAFERPTGASTPVLAAERTEDGHPDPRSRSFPEYQRGSSRSPLIIPHHHISRPSSRAQTTSGTPPDSGQRLSTGAQNPYLHTPRSSREGHPGSGIPRRSPPTQNPNPTETCTLLEPPEPFKSTASSPAYNPLQHDREDVHDNGRYDSRPGDVVWQRNTGVGLGAAGSNACQVHGHGADPPQAEASGRSQEQNFAGRPQAQGSEFVPHGEIPRDDELSVPSQNIGRQGGCSFSSFNRPVANNNHSGPPVSAAGHSGAAACQVTYVHQHPTNSPASFTTVYAV